jgi:hypothetical protein
MEISGQLHAPVALSQGKQALFSLYKRPVEPQSPSGCYGEKSNSLFESRLLGSPTCSLVAIAAVLSRLQIHYYYYYYYYK